jgi:LPS export ABC transporter protein LptC
MALGILLLILGMGSCKKTNLDSKTPVMDRNLPDETSYNIEIFEYKEDRIEYILKAAKIERFYDRKILNAYDVLITTYDELMQVQSTMKADTTIVDDARNMIHASGNVMLSSPNGTIQALRIAWDRNSDEIVSPNRVILTRENTVLRGINLRTNSTISFAELETVSAEGTVSESDIDW